VFDGFANIHTLKQAKIGVLAQDAALEKMKNDISLNVVNAYLQILFAKEQVKVAKSQVEISEFEVQRTTELFNAGVVPQGVLINIKSTLASDQQNLILTENTLVITSLQLAQFLQIPEMSIEIEDVNVELANQEILSNSVMDIYNKANETFPEIKLAELNILSAEESMKIAQASYMPSLTFSAGMNSIYQHRQGTEDFINFSDQLDNNFGRSLSFALNIPLFNRYQFRSNVNKSKINFQKIQYNLDNEKLRLRETIQTAYTDALAASKSFDAAVISVKAQDKAFEYARERFTAGAINSFEFNQTKNNLLSTQSQLIRAKYEFIFKLKVLEFYYGIPLVVE
jgi:outer membrane protein